MGRGNASRIAGTINEVMVLLPSRPYTSQGGGKSTMTSLRWKNDKASLAKGGGARGGGTPPRKKKFHCVSTCSNWVTMAALSVSKR